MNDSTMSMSDHASFDGEKSGMYMHTLQLMNTAD